MAERFQPYVESDAASGASSVHEDWRNREPSSDDDDFEHDTPSIPGSFHSQQFPSRDRPLPPHRSSDPSPVHGTDSGYQSSYYASSEVPPESYGRAREHSSRNERYHYNRMNIDHEECERRFERVRRQLERCRAGRKTGEKAAESQIESLRIRLFHKLREGRNYGEAEELYHETVRKYDDVEKEDTAILDLKFSFAAMLIEQERFQEAEPISKAVWEKREQCPGPPLEECKKSHRQLCSILCAVGRHKDAEKMHMMIYQSDKMDAWALENGDEVCQRRKEQGQIKKAKEMQEEVWKERLRQHGPGNDLSIRSGLRLIGFLEELVATIDQGGTDAERRLDIISRQAFQCEIEVNLRKIWNGRLHRDPNAEILNAGHKLGIILFRQTRFPEAEEIFIPVWEGKKTHRAAEILRSIWQIKQTLMNGEAEAISSGEDLVEVYRSLRDWVQAEGVYRWILQHKRGCPTQETDKALWNVAETLCNQGKHCEAEDALRDLYRKWTASSPNSNWTLQCGQLLAQSLSTQNGKIEDALKYALDVFNARGTLAERGVAYLDSGRLYGSLLLKVEKFAEAERILGSVWGYQAEGSEEQKMRLKCGHLYGLALEKRHKYPDAKRILEAVTADQGAFLPAGDPEIAATRRLLEEVNALEKEKKKGKRNSGRRRGLGIFVSS